MIQGFLRISRDIVDWDWYTEANTFRVFMHLLLTANYKDCSYKGIMVKRGQVATSRMEIAKALRMSEQNVRTSLAHLKSTNEITSESTNKLTIITVYKYDSWQKVTLETNQQGNQQANHELTSNQPTIEEERNNIINNNKEKKDTNVSSKEKSLPKTNWRKDREVYNQLVQDAENELIIDVNAKEDFKRMFPNGDYERTIMKCCMFWKSDKGYQYKLNGKSKNINMTTTIKNNLDKNVVYSNQSDLFDTQEKKEDNLVINGQIYK